MELILVMSILTIIMALTAPSLASFFRGRTLDAEARRLLSLTRYGQSRAVSEGVPMVLWVDTSTGTYGLTQEGDYSQNDSKAIDVTIDEDLHLEVEGGTTSMRNGKNVSVIHFLTDGGTSTTSLTGISMVEGDNAPVWITQAANKLCYEIREPKANANRTR